MGLSLVVGPANAGKVALLLDRYCAALDRDPVLVVPNRAEVERIERELLERTPALLGGSIGTFDDLFDEISRAGTGARPLVTDTQRRLLVSRVVGGARLNGLSASARFPGFAGALGAAIADASEALLAPGDLEGPLGDLYARYLQELDAVGRWDRQLRRRHAAERVGNELDAWDGRPVFAYGFEDFTGAEWTLLDALAGRAEVTVSLPYEPGRPAFASLVRTAGDLGRLAGDSIEELPPALWDQEPALAHLERALFAAAAPSGPPSLDGAVRFLEAAGSRGALELAAEEILGLLAEGTPAHELAVVCPSVERYRAPLETAFGALEIPYALEGRIPFDRTPLGRALVGLVRFAWLGGERRHLFAFLRSRYSGLPRSRADFLEGRLRGRAVTDPVRVEEEAVKLLGHPLAALDRVRGAASQSEAVRTEAALMLQAAYGLESPPTGEEAALDLRAQETVLEVARDLDGWADLGREAGAEQVVAALERATVRLGRAREPGKVAVLDLERARTRRFEAVVVVGLEEGTFPRRSVETPFLPDEERRELEGRAPGRRLARPDSLERDRYLFYAACTRPRRRLVLVREAAGDDGRPREASPFWLDVRACFAPADVARWTRGRRLSELTWELERAPSERERLRAAAALGASDPDEARALARANGWERRLDRALAALDRPTALTGAALVPLAEQTRFSVTELETFATCSSMWLIDRVVDPRAIDAELDARIRGSVAHSALYRFYTGLPKRLGVDQVDAERLEDALAFMRECLAEAIEGQVRLDLSELDRLELEGTLGRDLEHFVRQEAGLGSPLVPRRFEVTFGTQGAAVELQRGLDLGGFTVSGKIDRIDLDPMSARGIVQDYKSGSGAPSAKQIEADGKLQAPLYVLALRDLIGIEPLGGLYRALAGSREARGLVRASAEDAVPGLKPADYLEEDEFWGHVDRAVEGARTAVGRVREGDVRHDPRGGACPTWCDRWPMCRVRRA
jgi:ATP-dependent helicase/DNAse subunit B